LIRRARIIGLAALVILAVIVLITPTAEDPDSTAAVRRFLANIGFEVVESDDLPADGQAVLLLRDLRDADDGERFLSWAERGGTLVVADPGSAILGLVGIHRLDRIGFAGTVELSPACLSPVVVGMHRIVARADDVALAADGADEFISCFPAGGGAYLITRRIGAGRVTVLGGSGPLTNELLVRDDNATLAMGVAGPNRRITFAGPGTPADAASGGVWETLPDRGKAAVVAILGAALAFALVRARRLGPPMLESPITPIPASELVRGAARMYRRAHATRYAGTMLREASAMQLGTRLRTVNDGGAVVRATARATGMLEQRVSDILEGAEPRSDAELIDLGRQLQELATRTERGRR
jgi:hypothetical protein